MSETIQYSRIEITRLPNGRYLVNKFANTLFTGELEIRAACLETKELPADFDLKAGIEKYKALGFTVRCYPPVEAMGWPERFRLWRGEPRPVRSEGKVRQLRSKLSQAKLTLSGFDLAYDF